MKAGTSKGAALRCVEARRFVATTAERDIAARVAAARERTSWTMGKASVVRPQFRGCAHSPVPVVRFLPVVPWRLCAAGQVGPVVHMGAGKARRI